MSKVKGNEWMEWVDIYKSQKKGLEGRFKNNEWSVMKVKERLKLPSLDIPSVHDFFTGAARFKEASIQRAQADGFLQHTLAIRTPTKPTPFFPFAFCTSIL